MGIQIIDVFTAVIINAIHCVNSDSILSCSTNVLGNCTGPNQVCVDATKQCVCEKGYTIVDGVCEIPSNDGSSGHATVAVVTIFVLALVVCGLFLIVRKYNLVEYVRQQIGRRRNDVMYEDVMIGQDDPPLSP